MAVGLPQDENGLVFPNSNGEPLNHGNILRRIFSPALKRAGLPRIRFHDLRHFFASLLLKQGEGIVYIANQMGHSSPNVTLGIYAHLMGDRNEEAPRRFENAVFGATGSKMVAETKKGVAAETITP